MQLCTTIFIPVEVENKSDDDIKMTDPQSNIKEKFLVDMPQDFYDFWEFCKDLNHTVPQGIIIFVILLYLYW